MLVTLYSHITTTLLPMLLAGIGFGLLITVHEFGHFFFCKLFGIGAPVFSIGFGPSLFKKKIGATEFRLSLIPLGGYCAIQGMSDPEAGMVETNENELDPNGAFDTKAFWQKFLVILGGILFNLVFAYLIFIGMYWGTRPDVRTELTISYIVPKSAAEEHKLEAGSILVGYNNVTFAAEKLEAQAQLRTFLETISASPDAVLKLRLRSNHGVAFNKRVTIGHANKTTGSLGIGIEVQQVDIPGAFVTDSFTSAVTKGIAATHAYIGATGTALLKMFKRRTLDGMAGPITMFTQTFKSARNGLRALWEFLGMISITLALMNLIPIGALDGGQLLFVLLEGILRRPLNQKLKEYIIIASWLLFLVLVIVLSYRDIIRLFQ